MEDLKFIILVIIIGLSVIGAIILSIISILNLIEIYTAIEDYHIFGVGLLVPIIILVGIYLIL